MRSPSTCTRLLAVLAIASGAAAPCRALAATRDDGPVPGRPAPGPEALSPSPDAPRPPPVVRSVRVDGEGRALATPDTAIISVGVTVLDASLGRATREAADRARRVTDALTAAGIAAADVQTARYDVQVERQPGKPDVPPRIAGYRVTNDLRFKVRALQSLGAVLERVVAAGANEVEGLTFLKEDLRPERAQALAEAVRSAREKAEVIVRAAGARLGEPLEIVEGERAPGSVPMQVRAMAGPANVPVEAGQIEVAARVEIVFALR